MELPLPILCHSVTTGGPSSCWPLFRLVVVCLCWRREGKKKEEKKSVNPTQKKNKTQKPRGKQRSRKNKQHSMSVSKGKSLDDLIKEKKKVRTKNTHTHTNPPLCLSLFLLSFQAISPAKNDTFLFRVSDQGGWWKKPKLVP